MKPNEKKNRQTTLGKAVKATVPVLMMLGGGATAASTRFFSSSASRRKIPASVVHVDHTDVQLKTNPDTRKVPSKKATVFGAFSKGRNKVVKPAEIKVDNAALDFLKDNDLLSSGESVKAQLSGNTLGRKTFVDFCHSINVAGENIVPIIGHSVATQAQAAILTGFTNQATCTAAGNIWHNTTGGACTSGGYPNVASCVVSYFWGGNPYPSPINIISTVGGAPTNTSPTISGVPASITVTEDVASDVNLSGVVFADADGDPLTVTLTANAGTLAASSGGSVTVGGSGTGTLTLAGTISNIHTFLDTTTNVKYTTVANDTSARTITVIANDGTINSASSNITVNILDIADITSDTVPANGTYASASNLDFTVTFDESVTVTGTPRIALNIGGTPKFATFNSGNATATSGTVLTFRYTIETGLTDPDGIGVTSAIDLNGGSIIDTDADGSGADLSNLSFASTAGVLVDSLAPTISAFTIPDSAHKVGDTVTATITVTSDTDDYTTGSGGISGTINGYALGSLSKFNDTTYLATFTITDGGTDIADGSTVPVSLTLDDSTGNTSNTFNTAINQASDAIYANLPNVDLTASTNTIAEDGGSSTLTATLSNSLNNQWPVGVTVNLAYTGTGTAGTDYSKSDSITISTGSSTGTSTVTGTADTLYDAASAETAIVDISSLSEGNEGATNQQTISITDAESAPKATLSIGNASVAENGGTSTITAMLDTATYADVTVNLAYTGTATLGGTDANTPSASITISADSTSGSAATGITAVDDALGEGDETIIIDIGSVSGGSATENGVQQQTVTITDDEDTLAPTISSVSIPNNAHKVGDTVTATIIVTSDTDNYTTGSGGISGNIDGYVLGSLSKTNDTTYTATITITDGGTDIASASNVPVNLTLTDSAGNSSGAYTTAINQASDAIYANLPDVNLTTSTNTIAEDGGISTLTGTLSGSMNNQWPVAITVNLAYTGSATAGTDYSQSNSFTIPVFSNTGTAVVTGIDDAIFDAATAETIIVDIASLSEGNEGTANQQTISITDAESIPTTTLSVGNTTVVENGGTSSITARLNNATFEDVTVNLAYSGSATLGGTDSNTPSGAITISAGATSGNAAIGITAVDDILIEGDENIIIDVTSVTGGSATESGAQQQTVTITDDEVVNVSLSVSDTVIGEAAGTSTVTATLDQVAFENVVVSLIYTGTASNGSDYVGTATITIIAGQLTGNTIITASDDSVLEGDETIIIDIDSVNGGNATETGTQQQTVTITDDETVNVSLSVSDAAMDETAGSSTVNVTLDQVTFEDVVVDLAYTGTATNGIDYVAAPATITISTGQLSNTHTLTATPDMIVEDNETIIIDITGVNGGNASENTTQQQTVTITEEDTDGIPSNTENQVPNASGVGNGDGNGDNLPDSAQPHVVSLPTASSNSWATIENIEGNGLSQISTSAAPANIPPGASFPFGIINFNVDGIAAGSTVTMAVFVDYNPNINHYMKLNHLTGDWDSIGATITHIGTIKTKISFQLTDGDAYDGDGLADGSIQDPGAPVIMNNVVTPRPIPALSGTSLGILASLMVLIGGIFGRRRLKLK